MRRISTPWLLSMLCLSLLGMGIASAFTNPALGDKVTAKAELPLRSAPPQDSYLVIKGEQVDVVREGEPVIIEDTQQIKGLFREDIWVKIKRERPDGGPQSGWVFFGTTGRGSNFEKRN